MDLDLGTLAAHISKDWKEQVDRFMNEMRQTAWSREHQEEAVRDRCDIGGIDCS